MVKRDVERAHRSRARSYVRQIQFVAEACGWESIEHAQSLLVAGREFESRSMERFPDETSWRFAVQAVGQVRIAASVLRRRSDAAVEQRGATAGQTKKKKEKSRGVAGAAAAAAAAASVSASASACVRVADAMRE